MHRRATYLYPGNSRRYNGLRRFLPWVPEVNSRGLWESVAFSPRTDVVYRVGLFELDVRAGELRKSGVKVAIQQQPLALLLALLENPGRVVTREELRRKLWPGDVHVDFDRSLNKAIVKLRDALGDPSGSPIYIETLPRHGYRLIAPVEGLVQGEGRTASPDSATPRPGDEKATVTLHAPGARVQDSGSRSSARAWRAWLVSAILLIIVVMAARALLPLMREGAPRVVASTQLSHFSGTIVGPLVADDSRIYFSMDDGRGSISAFQLPMAGGEASGLPTSLPNAFVTDISPDHSELLLLSTSSLYFSDEPSLWTASTTGGPPRRVGELHAHSATWSPDRTMIAFASLNDVSVARSDGSRAVRLATFPDPVQWVRWSPNGGAIRFTRREGMHQAIWEIAPDGRNLRPLVAAREGYDNCCGTWSADGSYYVFQQLREGLSTIWALREKRGFLARDTGAYQLTIGPVSTTSPMPGADGKRLYLVGVQPQGILSRYDAAAADFVPYLSGISAEGIAYSPDRRSVAYVRFPEGTLWRSRVDGSGKVQLTTAHRAGTPEWSPDGTRIMFSYTANEGWFKLYTIAADGGTPRELIQRDENEFAAVWSPDGASILYGGFPAIPADMEQGLRLFDLKTHRITAVPGARGMCCPEWAADGRHILAEANNPQRLMLYEVATRTWSELWRGPFNYFDFMPDGNSVWFDTEWGEDPAFYRISLTDHRLELVASLKGWQRPYGDFGMFAAMTPEGSPLILRNTSSEQIYALDLRLP